MAAGVHAPSSRRRPPRGRRPRPPDDSGDDEQVTGRACPRLPGLLGALGTGQAPAAGAQPGPRAVQGARHQQLTETVDGLHALRREFGERGPGPRPALGPAPRLQQRRPQEQQGGGHDGEEQPRPEETQHGRGRREHEAGGEELGGGVGVEELQRLHVAESGRREVAAAAPRDPGGGGAGEPVEDPDPEFGQDAVGESCERSISRQVASALSRTSPMR
ncbi:hypothetical protein ACN24M_03740 [Streptomyces microflavus]